MTKTQLYTLPLAIALAIFVAACAPGGGRTTSSAAPAASGPKPGMNAAGEVISSKDVQAGSGQAVKGVGDWEGEITGKPAANSPFKKLQIGMSMKQVTDLVGQPSDQGAYITGKAWIPFYYGSDRNRYEMVYKDVGRLVFAGDSGFMGGMDGHLIWIIHNPKEGPYR